MGDCKEESWDLTMGRQYGEYRAGMEMEVLLEGSHHRAGGSSAEGGAWRGSQSPYEDPCRQEGPGDISVCGRGGPKEGASDHRSGGGLRIEGRRAGSAQGETPTEGSSGRPPTALPTPSAAGTFLCSSHTLM